MSERDARDPAVLRSYEGLIFSTAARVVSDLRGRGVVTADDDLDDVIQLLRVKVWRALERYDPARVRRKRGESDVEARNRYVFMCVRDMAKDIAKRKRVVVVLIEDYAPAPNGEQPSEHGPRDAFDARYLCQDSDYAAVEEPLPLIPNTLSDLERDVLLLLYREFTHREIAERLAVTKGEVSSAVRVLRSKLADWRPDQPRQPLANGTLTSAATGASTAGPVRSE